MSTATSGRAREHRVSKWMQERGWTQIMRAAGSKGIADLVMHHPAHGLAWVQVGTARSKTLSPRARALLVALADDTAALPLLATSGPGIPTRLHIVTADTASKWQEFNP